MATATQTATEPTLKLVSENQQIQQNAAEAERALQIIDEYSRSTRYSWWHLGFAGAVIKKNAFWKSYPLLEKQKGEAYHSFEDFCTRRVGRSSKSVYRAINLREQLETIGEEVALRIPMCNAISLVKYKQRAGNSKWANPKWLEQAQVMSEDAFDALINEALPGAAKDEKTVVVKWTVDKSLGKVLDKMMKAVKVVVADGERKPAEVDERECLEWIAAFVLNGQHEGSKQGVSNADFAFGKKKKASK